MKRKICAILILVLPSPLLVLVLRIFGHRMSGSARIGFSWVQVHSIEMLNKSRIGHFNFIKVNSVTMGEGSYIRGYNRIRGPLRLVMAAKSAVGNRNSVYRAPSGVSYGDSVLSIGELSKITAGHRLDCTRSIIVGKYSILAGHDSQLWTHGYYHDAEGPGRFRVDGEIKIGDNVYVGTRSTITAGVTIVNAVTVGANACVSKSLLLPGTYVNQPLRFIERGPDERNRFRKVTGYQLCEEVYERNGD